jgi:hypothetical protein
MARRRNAGKARNIRLVRNVSPDKARLTPCRFDLGNQRGPLFLASAARNHARPAAAIAIAAPRPIHWCHPLRPRPCPSYPSGSSTCLREAGGSCHALPAIHLSPHSVTGSCGSSDENCFGMIRPRGVSSAPDDTENQNMGGSSVYKGPVCKSGRDDASAGN